MESGLKEKDNFIVIDRWCLVNHFRIPKNSKQDLVSFKKNLNLRNTNNKCYFEFLKRKEMDVIDSIHEAGDGAVRFSIKNTRF